MTVFPPSPRPNTRMQRTRSSPSALRSPRTRCPLGGWKLTAARGVLAGLVLAAITLGAEYQTFSAVEVPASYRAVPQRGPDFIVTSYYPPSSEVPLLSVYEGMAPSFPRFCKTQVKPKRQTREGIVISTVSTSGSDGLCRESLLEIPGRGEVRHVWYHGLNRNDADLADSIIARIRIVTVKEQK